MSKSLVSGREVQTFLSECLDLDPKFEILRSDDKNFGNRFSEMLISPYVTNTSLGICMANKISLHLSLLPISYSMYNFLDVGAIELMYKYDIFVLSFGIEWVFKSKIAHKFLNSIFGSHESRIWIDQVNCKSLHVYLHNDIPIESLLHRLKSSYSYFPPKKSKQSLSITHFQLSLSSIKVAFNPSNLPDVLIVTEITSEVINSCFQHSIPLIFICEGIIFDELVREIHYFLSNKMNLKLFYQNSFLGSFE